MEWSPWLDPIMRALDYTAGVGRFAGAGLANIPYSLKTGKSLTQTGDLGRVVRGQAPTASEYMERAGAKGSPWLDMGADIALDPTTYLTGGATKIGPVLGMAAIKRGGKKAATIEAEAALAAAKKAAMAEGGDLPWAKMLKFKNDDQLKRLEKQYRKQMQSSNMLDQASKPTVAKQWDEITAEIQARKSSKGGSTKAAKMAAQQDDELASMITRLEQNPYTRGYKVIEKSHGFEGPNLVVDIPGLGKKSVVPGDKPGSLQLLDYVEDDEILKMMGMGPGGAAPKAATAAPTSSADELFETAAGPKAQRLQKQIEEIDRKIDAASAPGGHWDVGADAEGLRQQKEMLKYHLEQALKQGR